MRDVHLDSDRCDLLYEETKLPITANTGTPYPCTQEQIREYEHFDRRDILIFISLERTTSQLTEFLDLHPPLYRYQPEALRRIWLARWDSKWGPDLLVKMLPDIDTAFFNNRLRENLVVHWSDSDTMGMRRDTDETETLGMTSTEGGGNCTVQLNRDVIFAHANPCKQMWQSLYHELVLVSFLQTCVRSLMRLT